MKEVISALEQLRDALRETQESLRAHPWPSTAISLMANDVIIYGGMTARAADTLVGVLWSLEEPIIETVKEEEGGGGDEGTGKSVQEPEEHPDSVEAPAQEPKPKASKGSKRARKRG